MSLRHKLTDHSLGVVSVALSTDCRMLASSSLDSAIHIWDTNTGRYLPLDFLAGQYRRQIAPLIVDPTLQPTSHLGQEHTFLFTLVALLQARKIRNKSFDPAQCCGTGSKLDPYLAAVWIRIPNTDPDLPYTMKIRGGKLDGLTKIPGLYLNCPTKFLKLDPDPHF